VKDYLDIDKMIRTARKTGADAIHPGYGFLAECADFAAACEKNGLIFIGPPAQVMRRLEDKAATKAMMKVAEIVTVPGPVPCLWERTVYARFWLCWKSGLSHPSESR